MNNSHVISEGTCGTNNYLLTHRVELLIVLTVIGILSIYLHFKRKIMCLFDLYFYCYYNDYFYVNPFANECIDILGRAYGNKFELRRFIDNNFKTEYSDEFRQRIAHPILKGIIEDYEELITNGRFEESSKNRPIDRLITNIPIERYLNFFVVNLKGNRVEIHLNKDMQGFKNWRIYNGKIWLESYVRNLSQHMAWFGFQFAVRYRDNHYAKEPRLMHENRYFLFNWLNAVYWIRIYHLIQLIFKCTYITGPVRKINNISLEEFKNRLPYICGDLCNEIYDHQPYRRFLFEKKNSSLQWELSVEELKIEPLGFFEDYPDDDSSTDNISLPYQDLLKSLLNNSPDNIQQVTD